MHGGLSWLMRLQVIDEDPQGRRSAANRRPCFKLQDRLDLQGGRNLANSGSFSTCSFYKPLIFTQASAFHLSLPALMQESVAGCDSHLLVWIDVDVAFDALLPHVGPGVAAHPLPLALGALVLSEAPLLALVGCQSFTFRSGLVRVKKKKMSRFRETP